MFPSRHLKTVELRPEEKYVTTYSSDYKPFSERRLQIHQDEATTEPEAAPVISPPQIVCHSWPMFFYKTSNSAYGSDHCPQPPSCSFFPGFMHPFGVLSPSEVVSSSLTDTRTQEVVAAREIGPLLIEEGKGQLQYVCGGKGCVSELQEAQDEQTSDVFYGQACYCVKLKVKRLFENRSRHHFMMWSHAGLACCEGVFRSVCREGWLHHLLHLPVASSLLITTKDAGCWDNSDHLQGLDAAIRLTDGFPQPTASHCVCCECLSSFRMQTFPPCIPRSSTPPLAHIQHTLYSPESCRKSALTEYQANYTAEWAQTKPTGVHPRHPPSGNNFTSL